MTEDLSDPNHCTLCRKRAGLPVPDVFANDEKPAIKPRPPVLDDAELHLICWTLKVIRLPPNILTTALGEDI